MLGLEPNSHTATALPAVLFHCIDGETGPERGGASPKLYNEFFKAVFRLAGVGLSTGL